MWTYKYILMFCHSICMYILVVATVVANYIHMYKVCSTLEALATDYTVAKFAALWGP